MEGLMKTNVAIEDELIYLGASMDAVRKRACGCFHYFLQFFSVYLPWFIQTSDVDYY